MPAISETWSRELVIYFFLQCKEPKEIYAILTETWGEHVPLYTTVKFRVAQFKRGDFSTCVGSRPGLPGTMPTSEIVNQIHELILGYRRNWSKSIVEQLGISRGSIIHED